MLNIDKKTWENKILNILSLTVWSDSKLYKNLMQN